MKIITKIEVAQVPKLFVPKRVAAYCRVSTLQEKQLHSLKVQKEHYMKHIQSNPEWRFAGIYADESSGRNNLKMQSFQALLNDCRAGKIDLILIKSISRMGRNTLQFLQACNELNALNVEVYFEIEKLYISDPKAVKLLTILASLHQNESEMKSQSIRWGHMVRFKNGTSGFASRPCYGYRRNDSGDLEPYPQEAEIVKLIFAWRRQNVSLRGIAKRLRDMGIKAPRGGDIWCIETIRKILNNEKYRGDVLLQKTYVSNYFTGKQSPNNGELPKYLIENHHEGIINK